MRSPEARRRLAGWREFLAGPCPTPMLGRLSEADLEVLPSKPCLGHYHYRPLGHDETRLGMSNEESET